MISWTVRVQSWNSCSNRKRGNLPARVRRSFPCHLRRTGTRDRRPCWRTEDWRALKTKVTGLNPSANQFFIHVILVKADSRSTEVAYLLRSQQPRIRFSAFPPKLSWCCWYLLTALLCTVDLLLDNVNPSSGNWHASTTKNIQYLSRLKLQNPRTYRSKGSTGIWRPSGTRRGCRRWCLGRSTAGPDRTWAAAGSCWRELKQRRRGIRF